VVGAGGGLGVDRGDPGGGADGKVGSIVDEAPDLDEIIEDSGVNRTRARGIIVDIREGLEDLRGELKPGAVEGRDVAPMPSWRQNVNRCGSGLPLRPGGDAGYFTGERDGATWSGPTTH